MPRQLNRRALLALGGVAVGTIAGLAQVTGGSRPPRPTDQRISVGELTLIVQADPWRLSLYGPSGEVIWDEAADETLGYQTQDGQTWRARRLASVANLGEAGVQLVAETDEPAASAVAVEVHTLGPRTA